MRHLTIEIWDQLSFVMQKEAIGKKKEAIGSRVNVKEAFGNKRKSKETEKNLNRILIYFLFKETENKEIRFKFWRVINGILYFRR